MPSTTPDLSTVTSDASSAAAGGVAPLAASLNVDGVRGLRRYGSDRADSAAGQASSKVRGAASGGAGVAVVGAAELAASRSDAIESGVRAAARSRSLRDDDENNRLRRGLASGAASAAGAGGALPRWRVREASSCQGGAGDAAEDVAEGKGGAAGSAASVWSSAGW